MSILEALGAGPSNLTVPLTVATVAGSIGVAGAAAAGCSAAGLAAGASSFLLQAASASSTHNASATKPTRFNLLFMEGRPLCDFVLVDWLRATGAQAAATRRYSLRNAILPRTSAGRTLRYGGLPAIGWPLHGRFGARHGCGHSPLLFRC